MTMAKLVFGRLTEAWKGEASDFTPLLAEQLDSLGDALGIDLAAVGKSEVLTAGRRRIDIVAHGDDGAEFVIENQYGRADHDHLTRGLAYAVARHARGLVVVAEEHRDEFKAVAQYLNDLAELDRDRGVSVWLVEAKAVRIGDSNWAPLFTTVVEPNEFTATVEQAKLAEKPGTLDEFFGQFTSSHLRSAAESVITNWLAAGHKRRIGLNHVVLEAAGPAVSGVRTVVAVFNDGQVLVPFSSYAGVNSGIEIPTLTTSEFREGADALFQFSGTEKQARTRAGWLTTATSGPLLTFCLDVAEAYKQALSSSLT
ncbi:hypothetical protein [Aeromicrobium endophyticum]|uniref:DUF4268 domain-containing protein n=1 Tax=Aeromicrobium endophyticum TaxID=2292704 RepID=A0A371P2P3_9ACTN|nr:hypothetical protein [Aeromicrobium endophyticum]REK70165.1 hypothetical protein DX116_13450 [Aeromicrobium endophyticum]